MEFLDVSAPRQSFKARQFTLPAPEEEFHPKQKVTVASEEFRQLFGHFESGG
jgi:hypothetical protein